MTPCDRLLHPALSAGGPAARATPPERARLTDRERLALVLQAAALLSHLETAGWRLRGGWEAATVDGTGLLRSLAAGSGRRHRDPCRRLADFTTRVFGGDGRLAGRGAARRLARSLARNWRIEPGGSADRAVAQLLDRAVFLWRDDLGPARATLVAEHVGRRRRRPWVAGPSWFRLAALARAGTRRRLAALLSSPAARRLWWQPAGPGSPGGRLRARLHRWSQSPPADPRRRREWARTLFAAGRFDAALAALADLEDERARVLRARCRLWLGAPAAAKRELAALTVEPLTDQRLLEVARVAARACRRAGEPEAAANWVERALASVAGWLRPEAHLLAAEEAAARRDLAALRHHLRRARVVLEQPDLSWRWFRAAGRGALARGRGSLAAGCFGRALAARRRALPPFSAALLWAGLAEGRRLSGDLRRAERAAAHAARLHAVAGSPRATRSCLTGLAEARLRRGRSAGLEDLIAWSREGAGDGGALAARRELVVGRPRRALERLSWSPGERLRGERAALAARALGWLGRSRQARALLIAAGRRGRGRLEPEELPAAWALAGERERARSAARGPAAGLWHELLARGRSAPERWARLDALGGYRGARLVYDAELLAPGCCPAGRLQRAARRLAQAGAETFAARLEAAERSAWQAVADYLAGEHAAADEAALGSLLAAAGAPAARLRLESGASSRVVVAGRGGRFEIEEAVAEGRLVLATASPHPRLAAVLRLIADRWPPPPAVPAAPPGGMIGESAAMRTALERSALLAPTALPVLVRGETGTGKELLARRVHELSKRAAGPFLPLNCAAVARELVPSELFGHVRGAFTGADRDRAGVFEAAGGGSVFLDEIGDLPLAVQGALLRVLQEGEVRRVGESSPRRVDARVVAATHRDLASRVRDGRFRRDLFFRLQAATIELPPLRRRGRDVLLLAEHFLRRLRPGGAGLSPAARRRLMAHDWPGNVRELENALAVAVALSGGGPIEPAHLELAGGGDDEHGYHARVARFRRRLIEEALEATGGNRAAAARRIGLSRQAMSYLVRSLGVAPRSPSAR